MPDGVVSYRRIDTAKPFLVLPNGTRADSLRLGPLTAELRRLHIPGLRPDMGKPDVLGCYEAAVSAKVEAMRRNGSIPAGPLSPSVMRQAAQEIERAAA